MDPLFFTTPDEFRAWLEANHATETELFVGFYKKASGRPTLTWAEAVEVALRYGWIDGIRRSIDEISFTNRFTPRKRTSNWSDINIRTVERLIEEGLMHPAGLAAFEARKHSRSAVYSFEQGEVALTPEDERLIAANPAAWENWQKFPPSYRKLASWWVISAKRPETRTRRLQQLIDDSARGERVAPFRPTRKT